MFRLASWGQSWGYCIPAAAQTKEEIAHSVKEELTKSMSSFGFMIIQTLVRKHLFSSYLYSASYVPAGFTAP